MTEIAARLFLAGVVAAWVIWLLIRLRREGAWSRDRSVSLVRRALCRVLGGHSPSRVPVYRDGKARIVCGYGCGWESAGIEDAAPSEPVQPRVWKTGRRLRRVR